MENSDRIIFLIALGAVVVALVFIGGKRPIVGTSHEKIPDDRINVSDRHAMGIKTGPMYLLSNLPAYRHNDEALNLVTE